MSGNDLFFVSFAGDNEHEAEKLFNLLDFDDDKKMEFPEFMLYLFSTEENLSREQILRRSYNFYDKNNSGKISKDEMLEALVKLERIDTKTLVETKDGQWLIPGLFCKYIIKVDFRSKKKKPK